TRRAETASRIGSIVRPRRRRGTTIAPLYGSGVDAISILFQFSVGLQSYWMIVIIDNYININIYENLPNTTLIPGARLGSNTHNRFPCIMGRPASHRVGSSRSLRPFLAIRSRAG